MASNSPFSSGASSILKSAASRQKAIADFQDAQMAAEYRMSGYTDTAYNAYKDYLQNRIKTLSSLPDISSQQKALTLSNTLTSAVHSNVSASIARENIQVMAGNATPQDKLGVIQGQYARAVGIGDYTLAQQLESQAYSVSQSIQYQKQVSADSAQSYAKAAASAKASGENGVANSLENALSQLNTDIKAGGRDKFLSTLNSWLKTNTKVLDTLGVKIDPSAKNADMGAKYFSIVNAIGAAKLQAYQLAYNALLPTDPTGAQSYLDKANNLVSGKDTLPTLAGTMTHDQIQLALNSPGEFVYNNSTGKLEQSAQQSVAYDYKNNTVVPVYSGNLKRPTLQDVANNPTNPAIQGVKNSGINVVPINVLNVLNKLGLEITSNQTKNPQQGETVQATVNTPKWLQNVIGTNGAADIYVDQNGNLRFQGSSQNGQAVYTITQDQSGKIGLFQSDNMGDKIVGGDYGYNPNNIASITDFKAHNHDNGGLSMLPNGNLDQMASIFQNPNNLVSNAQMKQNQDAIDTANLAAAKAMISLPPPRLPNISLAPSPAPRPIQIAAPKAPQTVSVSQAHPVQSPTINPQQPSGISLQGGGFNLQGGGGISLQ